jgi:hypothetical protein
VSAINQESVSNKIYSELYEQLVLKTLSLLNQGKKKEAFENCYKIVNELKDKVHKIKYPLHE